MSKHRMKRRTRNLLVVLLVVTAAGAALHYKFGGGIDARAERFIERVDAELNLDDVQLSALRALKSDLAGLRREMRSGRDEDISRLVELVTAATLDQQALLDLVQEKTRAINERAPAIVAALAGFTDGLSPAQKAILREEIAERRERIRHRGRWHD